MRISVIGSGEFGLPTLEALVQSNHDIACVITQPDRRAGRGRRLAPTPLKQAACEFNLPVQCAENINTSEWIQTITDLKADLGVVLAFGQLIRADTRAAFSKGCINLHPSRLPKYRGAAPVPWAIIRGETTTGVTVFKLVDRMDAGPVLVQRETRIGETETANELLARLSTTGASAILEAIMMFEDGRSPDGTPQYDADATQAPKFGKHDGRVAFAESAHSVVGRINGLWSWPGAACRFQSADGSRDEIVTLARAKRIAESGIGLDPGVLNQQLHAAAADGCVQLLEIKPHNGKLMAWRDFVNGRRVQPGDRLVSLGD